MQIRPCNTIWEDILNTVDNQKSIKGHKTCSTRKLKVTYIKTTKLYTEASQELLIQGELREKEDL